MIQEKALARAQAGSGSIVDFSGLWVNELGSTMDIKQAGSDLSGSYVSVVSSEKHQTEGQLKGQVNGDLIAFTVRWDEFQAITAWTGQINPKSGAINMLWQMTKRVDAGDEWASINAGADTFMRSPA